MKLHTVKAAVSPELAEAINLGMRAGTLYNVELRAETCGGWYWTATFALPEVASATEPQEPARPAEMAVVDEEAEGDGRFTFREACLNVRAARENQERGRDQQFVYFGSDEWQQLTSDERQRAIAAAQDAGLGVCVNFKPITDAPAALERAS